MSDSLQGSKGKGNGLSGGQKALLALGVLPLAALVLPTLLVVALAMLPTVSAAIVERGRDKSLAQTVGMLNLTGCLPLVIELWSYGQRYSAIGLVMEDVMSWLIAFGAAGLGWLIHYAIPPFVATYLAVISETRVRVFKLSQRKLVELWGEELAEGHEVEENEEEAA